jgi:hypothetical protein
LRETSNSARHTPQHPAMATLADQSVVSLTNSSR